MQFFRGTQEQRFPSDESPRLKSCQEDSVRLAVSELVDAVTSRVLRAAQLVDAKNELTIRIEIAAELRWDGRFRTTFPYLEVVFTFIAAHFRLARADVEQFRLGESEQEQEGRVARQWWAYFREHLDTLMENPRFTRDLALCIIGKSRLDPGRDAFAQVLEALESHFDAGSADAQHIVQSIVADCRATASAPSS